jgi:hypothetical protein
MLVRLLIAVLMLTGPTPVRVCTCAASARPSAPVEPPLSQPVPEGKTCGCAHRAKASAESTATIDKAPTHDHARTDGVTGHSHPDRHDRDCPAVNPRPVVSAAVLTPAADAPTDPGFSVSVWVEPSGTRHLRAASRLEPQPLVCTIPLYISLLTLRN